MADNNSQQNQSSTEETTVDLQQLGNMAFDEDNWQEQKDESVNLENISNEPQKEEKPEPPKPETKPEGQKEETVDATEYLKKELGYESWEAAKTEIENFRKQKETPASLEYKNEESKRLAEALREGKTDEVYEILSAQKQLKDVMQLDASKADDAAKIIKLALQYKYRGQDFSSEDINYLFNKQHALPKEPVQGDDQTEEEYQQDVRARKDRVKQIERGMIIEAKTLRPELAKYQSELVLPESSNKANDTQPSPEELAEAKAVRDAYFQGIPKSLDDLKTITAEYKDEEVSLPISYDISAEEKAAIKPIIESLGDDFSYFMKRWSNPDQTINQLLMASDIHLLENKEKVFKKLVNEAGSQRFEHEIKKKSNLSLGDQHNREVPGGDMEAAYSEMADKAWSI